MRTLGIIGSGNIGSAIARLAVNADIDIILANSRGPETLQDLIAELGPRATAGTVEQVLRDAEIIVLSIPLPAVKEIPVEQLAGKVILDTSNYYPSRDGRITELDSEAMTTSELVHEWLDGPRLVKAFSNILAHHIPILARPSGAADRSALPIASDDAYAQNKAAEIINRLGFDTVDGGGLAESWRFEPEAAGYTRTYLADPDTPDEQLLSSTPGPTPAQQVKEVLASATRVTVADRIF